MIVALALLLAAAGAAQGTASSTTDELGAPAARGPAVPGAPGASGAPVRVGEEGIFRLRGGGTLAGRLVSSGPDGDVIELRSGERVRLEAGAVIAREGGFAPVDPEPQADPHAARVFLRDGRTLSGWIVSEGGGLLRLRTASGELLELSTAEIRAVLRTDQLRADKGGPPDPGRGRYVHVPSAFPLRTWEYTVTASAAELPRLSIGLTGWLAASAGASVPLLHGTPVPTAGFVGSLVAGRELLDWLRASGGVQLLTGRGGATAALLGAITVGSPAIHATLYAGPPQPEAGRLGRFGEEIVALAASARLWSNVALVSEAWITPRADAPEALGALAVRVFGSRLSAEAGLMLTTAAEAAPWIAVGWRDQAWRRE